MSAAEPGFGHPPAARSHGMVAASDETAAAAGRDVLADGGNAIDAAVAVSFTLGVSEPFHSGIGGGCFVTYFDATSGQVATIDGRGVAPSAASPDMFVRDRQVDADAITIGHRSVVVPGLVAGLELAHRRWGSRPLAELVEPAARLAEQGVPVTPIMAYKCDNPATLQALRAHPEAARLYLKDGGTLAAGATLRNPNLAATYRLIGREGADAFYRGEIAHAFAEEMRRGSGLITTADLAAYCPRDLPPLRTSYRDYEVVTMPPPSAGGAVLLQCLKLLEGFDLPSRRRDDPATLHLIAEAIKLAFADRGHYLGDPDFVDVPLPKLISDPYVAERRTLIRPDRPLDHPAPGEPRPSGRGTSSFSIADRDGNVLAWTQTIGMNLGSGVVIPGTGIILNHTMGDFSAAVGAGNVWGHGTYTSPANAIAPGKTPASSQAPTIVLRDGRPVLSVGAAGGSYIPTTVLQTILNVLDFGLDVQSAISAPRLHDQGEGLELERPWPAPIRGALARLGHTLRQPDDYHHAMASWAQAVARTSEGWQGGADPRADGAALGIE